MPRIQFTTMINAPMNSISTIRHRSDRSAGSRTGFCMKRYILLLPMTRNHERQCIAEAQTERN